MQHYFLLDKYLNFYELEICIVLSRIKNNPINYKTYSLKNKKLKYKDTCFEKYQVLRIEINNIIFYIKRKCNIYNEISYRLSSSYIYKDGSRYRLDYESYYLLKIIEVINFHSQIDKKII